MSRYRCKTDDLISQSVESGSLSMFDGALLGQARVAGVEQQISLNSSCRDLITWGLGFAIMNLNPLVSTKFSIISFKTCMAVASTWLTGLISMITTFTVWPRRSCFSRVLVLWNLHGSKFRIEENFVNSNLNFSSSQLYNTNFKFKDRNEFQWDPIRK